MPRCFESACRKLTCLAHRRSVLPVVLALLVVLVAANTRFSSLIPWGHWNSGTDACRLVCASIGPTVNSEAREEDGLDGLVRLLGEIDDDLFHLDILKGMLDAVRGRRNVTMPADWPKVQRKLGESRNKEVRDRSLLLSLVFRDPKAISLVRKTVENRKIGVDQRSEALQRLIDAGIPDLVPLLHSLLAEENMRGVSLRGMAHYPHPSNANLILRAYPQLSDAQKQDALATLASRVETANRLLDGIQQKVIDRRDLSTYTARQLEALRDKAIRKRLATVWGVVRRTSKDNKQRIAEYKSWLTTEFLAKADSERGRDLYRRTCGSCHVLNGEGGKIGPNLTGSDRSNLHYVLENIVDPSAVVAKDFQMSRVDTTKGRVITGLAQRQPNGSLIVQTPTERVLIPAKEVDQITPSKLSMMPTGLFDRLTRAEIRDLVGYLARTIHLDRRE